MRDDADNLDDLSDAGRARGDAILAEAVALGARLRRRRTLRRAAGTTAALGAVVLGLGVVVQRLVTSRDVVAVSPPPLPSPKAPGDGASPDGRRFVAKLPPKETAPRVTVAIIPPDPTIVARYATRPIESRVQHVSDDDFLRSLADAGTPGGLATIGGRTTLMLDRR